MATAAILLRARSLNGLLLRQHLPEGWLATVVDRRGVIVARTADDLLRRYEGMSTDPAAPRARAFDVREYTEGVKELAAALKYKFVAEA